MKNALFDLDFTHVSVTAAMDMAGNLSPVGGIVAKLEAAE